MKDYYKILNVLPSSSESDIKKAYRKLALKYHPDKNSEDGSDDMFKEISEAYSILGDANKKKEYDDLRSPRNKRNPFGFDDWVNNFKEGDGEFGKSQFRQRFHRRSTKVPNTKYLDINNRINISLIDAFSGKSIDVKYSKKIVDANFKKSDEHKELKIKLNLRKKYAHIIKENDKYIIKIRLEKLGNEDVHTRINMWGEKENILLCGDYNLIIELDIPDNILLEESNIIQLINIPLYKAIIPNNKIRIETIIGKSYDAEINSSNSISNLKLTIDNEGILGSSGKLGKYIIRFNVDSPNISKLNKKEIKSLEELLSK